MAIIDSPLGLLAIRFDGGSLCQLEIGVTKRDMKSEHSELVDSLQTEIKQYFDNKDFKFTFPVRLKGTDFQQRVWSALRTIPVGSTLSYGELADKLQSSPRAVGNACRANPAPIIVPCHRVIGKNGLGGYAGHTAGKQLAIKKWLLHHEGVLAD